MRVVRDGVGIHVIVNGADDAPPVVLLHGLTNSSATYDFLLTEFPSRRLIRIDLRGHGQSDRARGHYLISDYTADVIAVIDQTIGGPAPVVGHSLGGMIAAHVAQQRPDLVTSLFLEDAGLYAGEPDWMTITGFGENFAAAADAIAFWHDEGTTPDQIAAQLGQQPDEGGTVADLEELDALRSDAIALYQLDPTVFEPVLAGTVVTAFDPNTPFTARGVLLKPDDARGAAFLERDIAKLNATNPQINVITMPGSGHAIHHTKAHRPSYLDHLHHFLEQ